MRGDVFVDFLVLICLFFCISVVADMHSGEFGAPTLKILFLIF